MTLLAIAVAGAACAWLAGGSRQRLGDRARHLDPSPDARTVSIVVPARDEEHSLHDLLRSIATSRARPGEVLVVDDGSTDATADVARAGGARVVEPGEPPSGWTGKAWACHCGAEAASGGLLLFLDADVRLDPAALGSLLGAHGRRGGLVSVQPHHTVGAPSEHLSAIFNAVAVLGAGACSPVITWRRAAAVAYGPCLLVSRPDYERAGGHAAVRSSVVDDLAFARACRDAGVPTTALTGGGLVTYRMYPGGLGELLEGWTKNMATGATIASRPAVLLTAAWVASLAAVAAGAAISVVRVAIGRGDARRTFPPYMVSAASVGWAVARVGTFSPATAAGFPVPLAVFVGVFARSSARLARGASVRWRGRDVMPGAEV